MKPTEIKFLLYTRDLVRTRRFYSAIGMNWGREEESSLNESGLPKYIAEFPELAAVPHLWGDLGNNEFMFFVDKNTARPKAKPDAVLMVYFDDEAVIAKILETIKSLGLFVPGPGFDPRFRKLIQDPDERQIELCSPNPFRV